MGKIVKTAICLLIAFQLHLNAQEKETDKPLVSRKVASAAERADRGEVRKWMFIGAGVCLIFLSLRRAFRNRK